MPNTLIYQEKQRDALVAYYLVHLIPHDEQLKGHKETLKTANDLYEFLLMDNQVTAKVTDSPISEAIASLQLYINRVLFHLEPDIEVDKEEAENWQQINRHYSLWAANQRLALYPENFIDPSLRQNKTPLFTTLENNLSQGRISEESVQQAILNYLNEFETISDLELIRAYQTDSNLKKARFYFIASTRTQPYTYYWRQLDLQQRNPNTKTLYPSAWSSWQEIKLGLTQAINQSVSPVFFNGRLSLVWLEQQQEEDPKDEDKKARLSWSLQFAFKRFNENWSSPQSYPLTLDWNLKNSDHLFHYATVDPDKEKIVVFIAEKGNKNHSKQVSIDVFLALATTSGYTFNDTGNKQVAGPSSVRSSDLAFISTQRQAQFLNFPKNVLPLIRLNTLFAKQLVQRANRSLASIFHRDTQSLTEPAHQGNAVVAMDFSGANGLYFWELFFHTPFLISYRLQQEQRFLEAMRWIYYLIDPQKKPCWQVRPLIEAAVPEHAYMAPMDPDALAASEPVRYQKALFLQFIQLLRHYGDFYYRRLTRDDLSTAKLFYILALKLLGERPDLPKTMSSEPFTLGQLVQKRARQTQTMASSSILTTETTAYTPPLVRRNPSLASRTSSEPFRRPYNQALLDQWEQLETRVSYLRRNLTLDGKPLALALFSPPMDPRALQSALANRGTQTASSDLSQFSTATIPPYRFHILWQKAIFAVEQLIQLGQNLLSTLERQDVLALEKLQYSQQEAILAMTCEMQQLALAQAEKNLAALQISQKATENRHKYYHNLVEENISEQEQRALDLRISSAILYATTSGLRTASAALNVLPNTFGLANGGGRWGAPLEAAAWAIQAGAETTSQSGSILETKEQYRRRRQDWQLQEKQAEFDLEQISHQQAAEKLQIQVAKQQIAQTEKQIVHLQALSDFLQTRTTTQQLYRWLSQQLSHLYQKAYDEILSFCLATQAAWQYEIGDFNRQFIQGNIWDDRYRGLLAGEQLKLSLQRMDQHYVLHRERELELIKIVSLKQYFGAAEWEKQRQQIVAQGSCAFELKQKDYDQDYPSHYFRRIKTISLSFPALLGPYQNIRAVLTQMNNTLLYKADIGAVNYLNTMKGSVPDSIKINLRANQQIALSSGMDDSGLFALNFGDERYLPFEGTGAVSKWQLDFPNPQHPQQQQLLNSLSDIIVHVRYTAREGGATFGEAIQKTL